MSRPAAGRSPALDSRVATRLNPARLQGRNQRGRERNRHARQRGGGGLSILTQLFQNLSRCVHLSPGGEGRKLGENTKILLFSFNPGLSPGLPQTVPIIQVDCG